MAQYLKSSEVKVFPFGTTRSTDPNGRIFNEQNLAQFVRNVTDKHSYVLSFKDNILEFVIEGYYFKADVSSLLSGIAENIYAVIHIVSPNGFKYLDGNDESDESDSLKLSKFTGVGFVTAPPDTTTDGVSYLHVLVKNSSSNEYSVPEKSLARFNDTALFGISSKIQEAIENKLKIDHIDCGTSTTVITSN